MAAGDLSRVRAAQGVAGLQMQLFPQRFGNDDAACFINGEASVRSGTILWVEPSVNTIIYNIVADRITFRNSLALESECGSTARRLAFGVKKSLIRDVYTDRRKLL